MPSRLFNTFAQSQYSFLITALIGIALVLPSLGAGFFADDFLHYILINEGSLVKQPDNLSLFHLFSFIDTDPERRLQLFGFSITPWWISPKFSLLFFRPLSELTHYIDYQWLTYHPGLMHLHSIFWYGAMLTVLAVFYKTFCASHKIALLSFLFFIADSTHGFTVAWLANRNAIIAATFCLLALLCHHRFRECSKIHWYIASILAVAACFLAAEAGIVVGAFLFAYAVFLDKDGAFKGLLYLIPALAIFIIWLLIYKHYGYGASGNNAYYVDPLTSPVLFLQKLPDGLLRSIAIEFNPLPIHLINPFKPLMVACGLIFLLALLVPAVTGKSARYRFFLSCMLLAIVPITSAELQDRNMMFVGIAASPILAYCIRYLNKTRQHFMAHTAMIIILAFHVFISGLLMLPISYAPKIMAQGSISAAKSLPDDIAGKHLLALGIPVFDASYIAAIRRTNALQLPENFWNVTTQIHGLHIERISSHTYRISNAAGLLGNIDFILRDMTFDPIKIGELFDLNGLTLTIEALDDSGTPLQARLDIDTNTNEKELELFYWENRQLLPMALAIGESREFK